MEKKWIVGYEYETLVIVDTDAEAEEMLFAFTEAEAYELFLRFGFTPQTSYADILVSASRGFWIEEVPYASAGYLR